MSAARWASAAAVARFIFIFAVQIYFVRLLGPDVYGVYATAALVVILTGSIVDLGLPFVLLRIQAPPNVLRVALTWQCIFALTIGCAIAVERETIAKALGDPRAAPLVATFAIAVALNGPGASAQSLLIRAMRNRAVAFTTLTSYFSGYCLVGFSMSFLGYGAWSLVVGTIVTSGLQLAIFLWILRPESLRPRLTADGTLGLMRSGLLAMSTSLTALLACNVDRLLVTRMLGSVNYAHFAAGANLANVPTNTILGALGPIYIALGSRLSEHPTRLGETYVRLLTITAVIIGPIYGVGAVVAPSLAVAIFGNEWAMSGDVLRALLLGVPCHIAFSVATPVLWNTERGHLEAAFQLLSALATVLVVVATAQYGLVAVAWAIFGVLATRAMAATLYAAHATRIPLTRVLRCVVHGCMVAAPAGALTWTLQVLLPSNVFGQLVLPASAGVSLIALLFALAPALVDRPTWDLIGAALPERVRRIFYRGLTPPTGNS